MKLNDLIHYQINTGSLTHQQKLTRLLIAFVAVMLVLTMISRAADSLTVAQVEVDSPKSGTIEHSVRKDGLLEPNREVASLAVDGVLVESVNVYKGAAVKSGDVLFTLNMDDLKKQITGKQLDQQKDRLALQEYSLKDENAALKSELALRRADEDYDYAEDDEGLKVRRALKVRQEARDAVDAFDDEYDWWDRKDDDWTIGDSDGGGVSQYALQKERDALVQTWERANDAVIDAKRGQDKSLIDAERKIEDAETLDDPSLQPQITALNIKLADVVIAELQAAIDNEGKVISDIDGVVTELNVNTGKKTTAEASAIIADASEGYRFKVSLDKEEAKYASRGDPVEVVLAGKQKGEKATIESVVVSTEVPGGVDAIAMVKEGEVGQSATMQISQRSESYTQCVPISAIRGTEADQYVLIMDEQETVLGKQNVTRKVQVTVADKNETRAALTGGGLQSSDKVVISSSKNIFEGDRVRLIEQ